MRIPQYKAWHKANKQIYHVAILYADVETVLLQSKNMLFSATFDEIELMQFTGRFDKHKKEVYEDDIVRVDKHVGVIVWDYPLDGWRMKMYNQMLLLANDMEIIGNINVHPEPMEE